MRLDRFFTSVGRLTRRECSAAARAGRITVNGETVRLPSVHIDPEHDTVSLDGVCVRYRKYFYIMLNKPSGYVSSTEDDERSVMRLLPDEYTRAGGFPCGRLDIDTVGLLLITNNGERAHRLLSPRRHVTKTYRFCVAAPLDEAAVESLRRGVSLGDFVTSPAEVRLDSPVSGEIGISEGKFHQIKRMMESVGSRIEYLERIGFGPLKLDPALRRGEWRELDGTEIDSLEAASGK